jgi:hypothetical protein
MHVSSGKSSAVRRFAHGLSLIMISLILLGIVIEGVLIGPSLFASTNFGRAIHGDLGVVLLLLTLLLPVVGGFSRLSRRLIILSVMLCVLTLIEAISAALGRRFSGLAMLHPANAPLMAALAMLLLLQAWHSTWQRNNELETSGGPLS